MPNKLEQLGIKKETAKGTPIPVEFWTPPTTPKSLYRKLKDSIGDYLENLANKLRNYE